MAEEAAVGVVLWSPPRTEVVVVGAAPKVLRTEGLEVEEGTSCWAAVEGLLHLA